MSSKASAAELRRAVQNGTAQLSTLLRSRAEQRRQIASDPRYPEDGRRALLQQHDAAARRERTERLAAIRGTLEQYRDVAILKVAPTPRPASAAESAWVAGVASIAPHLTPTMLAAQITNATAAGDRASLALLVPLAESKAQYKGEFSSRSAPELFEAVRLAHPVMTTDAERESQQNADWAAAADSDLRTIETIFSDDPSRAMRRFETHLEVNALGATLPMPTPGPFNAEWDAAQAAARVSRDNTAEHPTGTPGTPLEPREQQPDEPPSRPVAEDAGVLP